MRKPIIILTIITVLGILYSIFLHKQSEYVAGETRYYTAYEKHKAKEKDLLAKIGDLTMQMEAYKIACDIQGKPHPDASL